MKKKIIAFNDVLLFALISTPLIISSILILVFGKLNDFKWLCEYWYLVVLFAIGVMLPIGGSLLIRYLVVNNETVYFHYFPFAKSWKKAANNIDIRWNQNIIISEIKNIEIIKLTREEKQTKVFYSHWFNKYLKINLKHGNSKYVYIGNYSGFQIKRIIKILNQE